MTPTCSPRKAVDFGRSRSTVAVGVTINLTPRCLAWSVMAERRLVQKVMIVQVPSEANAERLICTRISDANAQGWTVTQMMDHNGFLVLLLATEAHECEKVYEVVKFVNPRDAVAALDGMAVHAVAGPDDADAHGILVAHSERDGCMVSFHDVVTNEETCRTDIRNFLEIVVP
jgi:hypothetical protein